jgi:hypothetical protein
MSTRTIPDGVAVTNHFSVSFPPYVVEANVIKIGGLGDELEVIEGPDNRVYSTGRPTKKELTLEIADNDPAVPQLMKWKEDTENGKPGHYTTGTITRENAANQPVSIWELERCILRQVEANDMSIDGAEVGMLTFTISYYRAKMIGP